MDPGGFIPPPPPIIPDIPPMAPPLPGMVPPVVPFVPPVAAPLPGAWGMNGKFVTCHACGHRFSYRLTRSVADRDRVRAEDKLRRMLHLEHDAVPCPGCGSYQPEMLPAVRREYRRGLRNLGVAVAALGMLACAVAYLAGWPDWWLLLALPAIGAGLIGLWAYLLARFDPNGATGAEERKAVGAKRADEPLPRGAEDRDFVAGPDGTIDVRYMVIYHVPRA